MFEKIVNKGLIAVLFLGLTQVFAWQMVYHHDANGNKIEGSLETLINAIEGGHKIRVKVYNDFYDTSLLRVHQDKVEAQTNYFIAGQYSNGVHVFANSSFKAYINLDTNGHYTLLRSRMDGEENKLFPTKNVQIKWFID